jgi:hypothetical protein
MFTYRNFTSLGIPPATSRIVAYFARNPTARPTVRELLRTLGVASASAQRDLDRLTRAGALRVIQDGRMRRYAAVMDSNIWAAVRILMEGARRPAVIGEAGQRSARYGVDLGQLESMLRLSVEDRILLLDDNAAFLAAARTGKQ